MYVDESLSSFDAYAREVANVATPKLFKPRDPPNSEVVEQEDTPAIATGAAAAASPAQPASDPRVSAASLAGH
jgi:hypothetical protein